MKTKNISIIIFLLASILTTIIYLTSCDAFLLYDEKTWSALSGNSGNGSFKYYLYGLATINTSYAPTILTYEINTETGELNQISSSGYSLAYTGYAYEFAVNPTNNYIYAPLYSYNYLEVCKLDSNKNISSCTDYSTTLSSMLYANADPLNRFLYITNSYNITSYSLDNDGTPSENDTLGTSNYYIYDTEIDNAGKYFVYTTTQGINICNIDQKTGNLVLYNTTMPTTAPKLTNFSPSNKYLYAISNTSAEIYNYDFDDTTGAISYMSTTSFGGGCFSDMAFTPKNDSYLYVSSSGTATLYSFSINKDSGELNYLTSFGTCNYPYSLSIDPTGQYLYVGGNDYASSAACIKIYKIKSNGSLSEISNSPVTFSSALYMQDLKIGSDSIYESLLAD